MSAPTPPQAGWYPQPGGQRYWDGVQWTEHFRPGPDKRRHLWWSLSPLYSCFTIAFIPALHAAIKLRRRSLWLWAVGLIVGDVIGWSLLSSDSNADGSSTSAESVGTVLIIAMAVAGTVHAFRMREEVFTRTYATEASSDSVMSDPAVASSLAARKRRAESVALSQSDAILARDLRIGRPDLQREYDDGGLVDVNHVPEAILVSHLGFTPTQARTVVEAREHIGRFESIDDLSNITDLAPRSVDAVRDRIVTL